MIEFVAVVAAGLLGGFGLSILSMSGDRKTTIRLITDGEKWAITKDYKSTWQRWWRFRDESWWIAPESDCWSDKETAEKWFRRLKA